MELSNMTIQNEEGCGNCPLRSLSLVFLGRLNCMGSVMLKGGDYREAKKVITQANPPETCENRAAFVQAGVLEV